MIEIINPTIERGRVRHALFDFDGTLSLIREGWQQVMLPMMVEWLMATPRHESEEDLKRVVSEYVTRSTGIQTIYQMIHLAEMVERRGGQPLEPLAYKQKYVHELWQRVKDRVSMLRAGVIAPDDLLVPGARSMLDELRRRHVQCYLASGTDEPYVLNEAAALHVAPYFAGIYGARDDYKSFSKKILVDRIISENHLQGPDFVVFGDGFVEIEDAKSVGGIAVGVASDEVERTGVNEVKRSRLIQAGADIIIPDFSMTGELVAYLFRE